MANPDLVRFIRENLPAHGAEDIRRRLLEDGIAPEEVEAAFAALGPLSAPAVIRRPQGKNAIYGILFGVSMIAVAGYIALDKPSDAPPPARTEAAVPPTPSAHVVEDGDARIFNGHYGYMVKLPPGYDAQPSFRDPAKTHEIVHLYPKGTHPTHFIHEGLYGQLGILRIEVVPRRTPGGILSLEVLAATANRRLQAERAVFTQRAAVYNGLNAVVFSATQPFAQAKAYLLGQKVYYIVTVGKDDELLNGVLETLVEVNPHDRPGR